MNIGQNFDIQEFLIQFFQISASLKAICHISFKCIFFFSFFIFQNSSWSKSNPQTDDSSHKKNVSPWIQMNFELIFQLRHQNFSTNIYIYIFVSKSSLKDFQFFFFLITKYFDWRDFVWLCYFKDVTLLLHFEYSH